MIEQALGAIAVILGLVGAMAIAFKCLDYSVAQEVKAAEDKLKTALEKEREEGRRFYLTVYSKDRGSYDTDIYQPIIKRNYKLHGIDKVRSSEWVALRMIEQIESLGFIKVDDNTYIMKDNISKIELMELSK